LPSQLNPAISTDVERVTLRALEKAKDDRYQSATDLAADLQPLELGFSGAARLSIDQTQLLPKPAVEVTTNRGRKLKRLAPLILGVLIVSLIAAWLLFFRQKPRPKQILASQTQQSRLGIVGNVIEAAISPDGKFVAYVNDENGRQSIWVRQITSGTDLKV